MDDEAVLAEYDHEMRERVLPDGPGCVVERVGGVVRHVGAPHDWNGVTWAELDEGSADAAIAAQVEYFTARGCEFEWKLYSHDRPADLGARLLAAGFEPEPPETLMVARVADVGTEVGPPDGIELRPVTDAAGVALMAAVQEQAFGQRHPQSEARLLAQLTGATKAKADGATGGSESTWVAVLAMAGDVPVSAARMELPTGRPFAGLWGGGTVPGWRGRGIYRALVAYRARIAAERGYRFLQVDASDQSRPILERLGFHALSTTTPYNHQP